MKLFILGTIILSSLAHAAIPDSCGGLYRQHLDQLSRSQRLLEALEGEILKGNKTLTISQRSINLYKYACDNLIQQIEGDECAVMYGDEIMFSINKNEKRKECDDLVNRLAPYIAK